MKKFTTAIQSIDNLFALYGFSPLKTIRALRATGPFFLEWRTFRRMASAANANWKYGSLLPMLHDRGTPSGFVASHYFLQDLVVAKRIYMRNPRRHIDVGSRIDGFVAHVASFRDIEVADIRPAQVPIPNVKFIQMDVMEQLPLELTSAFDSVSCLHVLEHFGLGRYGDRLDPYGYETGFLNLVRLLEPRGILYLSVPLGRQLVRFNAHRIFGLPLLLDLFRKHNLTLISFSYLDDDCRFYEHVAVTDELLARTSTMRMGCGIFELRKV